MKIFQISLLLILNAFTNIHSWEFWERTSGLDNQTIWSLAVNSGGHIFAGNGTDGVYRSTDNGISWLNIGPNLGSYNYEIPTIFTRSNGDIIVGISDEFADGGMYLSTDNGNSWSVFGIPEHPVFCIADNSNGDIFAGTGSVGMYRSTDNGNNWVQINQGLTDSHPTCLITNSNSEIFAGTIFGGVYRSTDNGDNWVQINQGLTNNYVLSLAINSSGDIFLGTHGSGAFRSTDNGDTWVQINQGLFGQNGQGYFVVSLAINSNGDIFAGTAEGVFQSTDNGDNWVQINQGLTNDDVYSLAINTNIDVFVGTSDGIFRTIPSANIKVFLQGPYASGSMSTTLRDNGYLPLGQPYNVAPFNYSGIEAVDTIQVGVVDWVLLELRSDSATQVSRRAAFLKSDGTLVDLDGLSNVKFPTVPAGNYYVVISHRNHLSVMTTNPIELSYSPVLYDFTTGQTQAYGTNPMKDFGSGNFAMIAGDIDGDGNVDYASDLLNHWLPLFGFNGYYSEDINLNSDVDYTEDLLVNWLPNFGFSSQVP